MAPRHGACPGAIPGNRTTFFRKAIRLSLRHVPKSDFLSRAPACAAESPKLRLPGAAPGRLASVHGGCGREVMHLPCKQAQAGALPAASTISLRETRPKHREESHKLLEVGLTPAPATAPGK